MKSKLRILISSAVLLIVILSVIYVVAEGEKREVKNLVITYNNVLHRAHLELRSGLMRRLTSEKQLGKIDSYIAYNVKNGRTIMGELADIHFGDIKIQGDSAAVLTTERWTWHYVDPATQNPLSDVYDETYGNTYNLKKTKGHWVVDTLVSNTIKKGGS